MANIIFSEDSHVADSMYGNFQSPIKSIIVKRAEAFEQESMIPSVFSEQKSTHASEAYGSMTAMSDFEPSGENGAYPTTGFEEGYFQTIRNVTWKNQFSVSEEMVEDCDIIDMKKKPEQFVTSYYRTKERFAAQLYGGAINKNASVKIGKFDFSLKTADGSNLFSTSHGAKVKGAAQINMFSDAFSADALKYAESKMQDYRDEDGNLLNVAPDTILIPNEGTLKDSVMKVVGSDKDPGTAYNGFNYLYGRWNIIIWPYLNQFVDVSTVKPWMLIDSSYLKDTIAAVFQMRKELTITSKVEDNDANTWRGRARFSAGFNDWRYISCGGLTNGTQLVSGT